MLHNFFVIATVVITLAVVVMAIAGWWKGRRAGDDDAEEAEEMEQIADVANRRHLKRHGAPSATILQLRAHDGGRTKKL